MRKITLQFRSAMECTSKFRHCVFQTGMFTRTQDSSDDKLIPVSLASEGVSTGNSLALVHTQTTPTEQPPLVSKVSANFCGYRVLRGQHNGYLQQYSRFSRPEPLLFLSSSSFIVVTRLSGPCSRPTTSQKIW
jgi:hypothetical protein